MYGGWDKWWQENCSNKVCFLFFDVKMSKQVILFSFQCEERSSCAKNLQSVSLNDRHKASVYFFIIIILITYIYILSCYKCIMSIWNYIFLNFFQVSFQKSSSENGIGSLFIMCKYTQYMYVHILSNIHVYIVVVNIHLF